MKPWKKKEIQDVKFFESKRVQGSGNKWYRPGDSKNDTFLIESKFTEKKSYSLSKEKLIKIYNEALFSFRLPMMSVKIQDIEVVVLFKQDFINLTKKTIN